MTIWFFEFIKKKLGMSTRSNYKIAKAEKKPEKKKEEPEEKKEETPKTDGIQIMKRCFLEKVTSFINQAIEEINSSQNFDGAIQELIKKIKFLTDSFDIVDGLSADDQYCIDKIKSTDIISCIPKDDKDIIKDIINKIKMTNIIKTLFEAIWRLTQELNTKIETQGAFCNFRNTKIKFDELLKNFELDNDEKYKNIENELKKLNQDVINNITIKINEAKLKLKDSESPKEIADDLKDSIIEKIGQIKTIDERDCKAVDQTIEWIKNRSIVPVLDQAIYMCISQNFLDLSKYQKACNEFIINYLSVIKPDKGLEKLTNQILEFIKDEKKQTLDNAKQIYIEFVKTVRKLYGFNSETKLGVHTKTMSEVCLDFLSSTYHQSSNNFRFLTEKYSKVVHELEIQKYLDNKQTKIDSLKELMFSEDDIKAAKDSLDLLIENCKKYIVKAKEHFGIIKKTSINTNGDSKEYKIKEIKHETLREVLSDHIGAINNIFTYDIKERSMEAWQKSYEQNIVSVVNTIIDNIKVKNKGFKIDTSSLDIQNINPMPKS